jgi:DNA-binding NarL/FixJ family response regulator
MPITAVIADDHEAVRLGVISLLEGSEIEIVGEALTAKQVVSVTRKHKPDILLLDVRLPDSHGLAALAEVREQCPETAVVMFSGYDNPTYIARSVALGASDYLLKGCTRGELILVIEAAVSGRSPTKAGQMMDIAATMHNKKQIETLTKRQSQVVRNIALGLSNKEIARALGISYETVKEHVQQILSKLDCTHRTRVAIWAIQNGIVP